MLIGLNMNIRGFLFDRIGQNQVDKLDNRSILTRPFQLADIFQRIIFNQLEIVEILKSFHDISQRRTLIIILVDRIFDGRFGSNHHLDIEAGHKLDVINGENIGRISHRHNQGRAGTVDWNQLVFLGNCGRNQRHNGGVNIKLSQVD